MIDRCLLCEKKILPFEPLTFALARGPRRQVPVPANTTIPHDDGRQLYNMPVHFACFGEMIAGIVTPQVIAGISTGEYNEVETGGRSLREGLRGIVARLVGELLDED